MTPLRALPRVFLPGAPPEGEIDLPPHEADKLRKVLRLGSGDPVAVLPGDGSVYRAVLRGLKVEIVGVERPATERSRRVILAQALPKGDKLDEILRAGTELGAAGFVLFPSDRTVVKWDEKKTRDRLTRAATIVREAAELAFRTILPTIEYHPSLKAAWSARPGVALDEDSSLDLALSAEPVPSVVYVGPEGGWSPAERTLFGESRRSLGPLVLRTEHAGPAALARLLID